MTNQHHRRARARARALALPAAIALLAAVSLLASAPAPAPTPVGPSGTWHLTFRDEFTGNTLDRTKWRTEFPWAARTISTNHEMEYYADDDLLVSNGMLHIRAERRTIGGFDYTSGMISSYSSFASSYGYFEIRARMPKGKGLWPAFWLVPQDQSWPPEIDVFEILGNDTNTVYMTNHYRDAAGIPQKVQQAWTGPDFSQDFHTFGVEWSPGHLVWYIDGVERFETTTNVPSKPMYVIANLAVGGDWPGAPDASVPFPSYLDVDYIRIYQRTQPRPGVVSAPRLLARPPVRFAEGDTGRLSTQGIVIHNAPRTAVVGRTERFSALLSGQPHMQLLYMLRYPDGHVERVPVRTDGHGYSSHTFRVRPYAARRVREAATVGIADARGRVLAFTRFAIQLR